MHEQHHAGAEVITDMPQSMTNTGNYPFFALDDVGCIGTESNLLDCLPQHNCNKNRGAENAGVLCLRKGEAIIISRCLIIIYPVFYIFFTGPF